MAVVVVITDRCAKAVAAVQLRDPGPNGDILERPVAAIAEQAVAGLWRRPLVGREGPPWTQ